MKSVVAAAGSGCAAAAGSAAAPAAQHRGKEVDRRGSRRGPWAIRWLQSKFE